MQLQKILKIRDQVPELKSIIQYTGKPSDPSVLSVSENLPTFLPPKEAS